MFTRTFLHPLSPDRYLLQRKPVHPERQVSEAMFQAVYVISLSLAAGIVAAGARRVLAAVLALPDFNTEMRFVAAAAAAYAALQLTYLFAIRFLKPTRSRVPLLAESCSQLAALAALPYLLQFHVPWPHPALLKYELFIYLGAVAALHAFFKLVSFFASLQGEDAPVWTSVAWAASAAACGLTAYAAFHSATSAMANHTLADPGEANAVRVGSAYAPARTLPAGAVFQFDTRGHGGQKLVFLCANLAEDPEPLDSIALILAFDKGTPREAQAELRLNEDTWATSKPIAIPEDATTCAVSWAADPIPAWLLHSGLRPAAHTGRQILVSGPSFRAKQSPDNPSFLVLTVDGLNAEHLANSAFDHDPAPALRAFASHASVMEFAYTTAPEPAAACMSLLTGLDPLRHGYLGAHHGPLPAQVETLASFLQLRGYATAAFTEGDTPQAPDLVQGSGFELGFDLFDPEYRTKRPQNALPSPTGVPGAPPGPEVTLDKAATWMEAHPNEPFFLFVRLRELASASGEYDNILSNLDRKLGAFFERAGSLPGQDQLVTVLTASYALDPAEPRKGPSFSEPGLHVPLLISVPGESPKHRAGPVSLEDIAPTLLRLAKTSFPYDVTGEDLLDFSRFREPIAVDGNPFALSIRTKHCRYTWDTGREPFTYAVRGAENPVELIDMDNYRPGERPVNSIANHPALPELCREHLARFLRELESAKAKP